MTISMYRASVPVFIRGLTVVSDLLGKGRDHAAAHGVDPASLVGERLAADMLPLAGQVQRASDTAKLSAARLTGLSAPSFSDDEASLDDLQARCAKTIAFLESVPEDAFRDSEARKVPMFSGERQRVFQGTDYLLTFALPNFFFHVATAHDILRHRGVAIGKLDYLGPFADKAG